MPITNPKIKNHPFLEYMAKDDEQALYALTHSATEEFNELAEAFFDAGSEIETVARDCIGTDFAFIAESYGFAAADGEELIASRDW